jgi:hypothetical protein
MLIIVFIKPQWITAPKIRGKFSEINEYFFIYEGCNSAGAPLNTKDFHGARNSLH